MYVGRAQTPKDLIAALELATRIFHPADCLTKEAIEDKKHLMSPLEAISHNDAVILKNDAGRISGVCFLVDREFYRNKRKVKGTFLTAICIEESSRGRGLSRMLMNATIAECERRGADFAILIARRSVDHFYNQFSFWGLSQYGRVDVRLAGKLPATDYLISPATTEDLEAVSRQHETTYSDLYGSCVRPLDYWKHMLWRTEKQRRTFVTFRRQDRIFGYVIFSGSHLHEIASAPDVSCLELLEELGRKYSLREASVKCSRDHPLIGELCHVEFSITQRQCHYGGHMVRVIDRGVLFDHLIEEIRSDFAAVGAGDCREVHGDWVIEARNGKVSLTFSGSPYTYRNTCFLMGAEYLCGMPRQPSAYKPRSFNLLLDDEA